MKDGLSHRQVNTICIDKEGFVWLATKNGLNRFDGYNFKVYNKETHGFPFNNFEKIVQDVQGDLWLIGEWHNADNVAVFDPVTSKIIPLVKKTGFTEHIKADFITAMADSTIFFGQVKDSFFYTWHPVRGRNKVSYPRDWYPLIALPKENCFLARNHAREVFKIDLHGNVLNKVKAPFSTDVYHPDLKGNGAYASDSITHHVFYMSANMQFKDVADQLPDLDNTQLDNVFNTGIDSIFWREGKLYTKNKVLIRDFVYDGFPRLRNRLRDKKEDRYGRIWLANDFGLFLLTINKSKFRRLFYQDPSVSSSNSYRSILVEGNDLYACNEISGVKHAILQPGESKKPVYKAPWQSIGYYSLAKTREEAIFGVSNNYIFELDRGGSEWKNYRVPKEQEKQYFWKIVQVAPDSFLLGCSFGLKCLNLRTRTFSAFDKMNQFPELSRTIVLDIARDENGLYRLCTNNGLYEYDQARGIVARYSTDDTGRYHLPAKEIQHSLKEQDGTYWLATTKGLVKWNKTTGQSRLFSKQDGLTNENIYAVYGDKHNRLWLSSDYGLMSFDKSTFQVRTYLTNAGITHNEFNRISHFKDSTGNIYFGSLNGITAFDPDQFSGQEDNKRATLAVTLFQQFNGSTNRLEDKTDILLTNKSIELHPADLYFSLSFSLLNYEDVYENTYYWKIEGTDTGWNVMKDHVLRLSRLPYGKQMLRIKARSGDGMWSNNELQYKLIVIKPLYLRTWFVILAVLVIATLLAVLYRVRVKRLQKENVKLDKIVKQKTEGLESTIKDLKASFEQQDILMKEIHHRVKNNLQVITVLLKLQLANLQGDARKSIEESISRVNSIALIHQYLYKNADLTAINLPVYVSELCQQIEAVYRKPGEGLTLINRIPPMLLDIDTAIPLGIILNELMVNSNKYAFRDRPQGVITIELQKFVSHYTLIYGDDGPGLPDDYSIGKASTLGMTIVKSLAAQLKGEVTYKREETRFYITFKDTSQRKSTA